MASRMELESAPQILEESELLKMIAEEKMRSEQHKTNFQILKIEHGRLQNETMRLQSELKASREECSRIEESNKKANMHFSKQINDLRSQLEIKKATTVHSEELLRSKIKDELDRVYGGKYFKIQSEADKYRDDFNKIRYDFTFLKSEYDYLQQESTRVLEEKKLKHDADVSFLRKEIQTLESKISTENSRDSQQLQRIRRENSHLSVKVKNLLAELESTKSNKLQSNIQGDEVMRILNRQLAECAENIKALESEKASMLYLKDGLKTDLSLCRENCASLTSELSSAQQEVSRLKSECEEAQHQFKLRENDLKIEIVKRNNEFERAQNKLSVVIQEQKIEVEVLKDKCQKLRMIVAEKEQEIELQKQTTEDGQFLKISELETDKSNLELELCNLERRMKEIDDQCQLESNELHDKISTYENETKALKEHNERLRDLEENSRRLTDDLEEERNSNESKQERINILIAEQKSLIEVQDELLSQRTTLKGALEKMNQEYQEIEKELKTLRQVHVEEMKILQSKLISFKSDHDKTINAFKNDAAAESAESARHFEELRKKSNRYSRLIKKLRQKLEVVEANIEDLEIQKAVFSQSIPKSEYDKLQRKLKELQKRHSEFRSVISLGPQSLVRTLTPPVVNGSLNWRQSQQDDKILDDVKQRLETLGQQQRDEMEELKKLHGSSS